MRPAAGCNSCYCCSRLDNGSRTVLVRRRRSLVPTSMLAAAAVVWSGVLSGGCIGARRSRSGLAFVEGFLRVCSKHRSSGRNTNPFDRFHRRCGSSTEPSLPHNNRTTERGRPPDATTVYAKSHSLTVCLVPPPSSRSIDDDDDDDDTSVSSRVWDVLTTLRADLRDPGFFRWPPHVNLLYPFVRETIAAKDETVDGSDPSTLVPSSILAKLRNAARNVEPFSVSLDLDDYNSHNTNSSNARRGFGAFGSSKRGVLWVYPESYRFDANKSDNNNNNNEEEEMTTESKEPILELQSLLEAEFAMCSETLKRRSFLPHMTLSHFDSLRDARGAAARLGSASLAATNATARVSETTNQRLSFWCEEFYLLERKGDDGQFLRRATIRLGNTTRGDTQNHSSGVGLDGVFFHDPPLRFPGMPKVEEPWVRSELQALKARRKANQRNRQRTSGPNRRSYRARSKAKRELAKRASSEATPVSEWTPAEALTSPQPHDAESDLVTKREDGRDCRAE